MRFLKIGGPLAILMILFVGHALAGDLVVQPGIGLKAGANFSVVQVAGTGTSQRTGFTGGAFFKLPINPLTLQLEALYSQKGFKKKSYNEIRNWDVKLDYFEIPATLNVEIPLGKINVYFYGGFAFGFLTSAEEKSSETEDAWVDISDHVSSTNWDFLLGFGFRLDRIYLDFRFNTGLSKMNETATDVERDEITDRTFSITAAYSIW